MEYFPRQHKITWRLVKWYFLCCFSSLNSVRIWLNDLHCTFRRWLYLVLFPLFFICVLNWPLWFICEIFSTGFLSCKQHSYVFFLFSRTQWPRPMSSEHEKMKKRRQECCLQERNPVENISQMNYNGQFNTQIKNRGKRAKYNHLLKVQCESFSQNEFFYVNLGGKTPFSLGFFSSVYFKKVVVKI